LSVVVLLLGRYSLSLEGTASLQFYWVLQTLQIAFIASIVASSVVMWHAWRKAFRGQLVEEGMFPASQPSRKAD
ncbi:MAG TPA: hypothetical protein VKE70_15570, partial [Candidatus Solibacter sp.]|nr:hypothetical protein [Candidatus Solibacter sp.]